MGCPHCDVALVPESYEGITIDRCPACLGTWLDAGELSHVVETREVEIPDATVRETLARAEGGLPGDGVRTLIACPQCGQLMAPTNYDRTSGVVIDHCPAGHGNWLDATELEKVQAHREYWDGAGGGERARPAAPDAARGRAALVGSVVARSGPRGPR